jgi:hypothetical protein
MHITKIWQLTEEFKHLSLLIGNLDDVFALKGEQITSERISDVIRVSHNGTRYYVKRYFKGGKGLRRLFGKPRIQSEWENLRWFSMQGIPSAEVVGYGMERCCGLFKRGALITREIPDTMNLEKLAKNNDPRLADNSWVSAISAQVANAMRLMHKNQFIHNDLKWRNILVDQQSKLYFIDCPLGGIWRGKFFEYRVYKEFAMLDRVARYKLRNTQRLRFYLQYADKHRLGESDKIFLRKLVKRKTRRISSFALEKNSKQF